ncbi:hypothetical protein BG842_02705 [Haladaptatus sp. W1]|nr:hypothetical protein BG842_02705 [Haladaptatus sp. W1]
MLTSRGFAVQARTLMERRHQLSVRIVSISAILTQQQTLTIQMPILLGSMRKLAPSNSTNISTRVELWDSQWLVTDCLL